MSDFEVRGADDFLKLSKALKAAGRTGKGSLRNQLHAEMKDAVKPLLPKAAQALAAGTPSGVDARSLRIKQVVQVKTGRDPGVSVGVRYGRRGSGLGASNARLANRNGLIRHPLFGDREQWFNTPAPAARGWFDETYRNGAPTVRPGIERAMERVVEQIIREAR